jgi:uncharacterized protein with NAD-binding domain and iron-sulfur cluster
MVLLVGAARRLALALPSPPSEGTEERRSLLWLIDRSLDWLWRRTGLAAEGRRTRMLIDLALTIVRGVLVDGLVTTPQCWFKIDDEDFRAWLTRHGAREETVQGGIVNGLYHAAFSGHLPLGAGTILHALLRMVTTYKGAILFRMRAGMGETVFAPLYLALRARGVRFAFFHSVEGLELDGDRQRVQRVRLRRQATVRDGELDYQPLIDVQGLPCWPSRPRLDQLVEGEAIAAGHHDLESWWSGWPAVGEVELQAGRDFDEVVLGLSLGVLPEVCSQLIADPDNPGFRRMAERVRTTQTQAAQLWLDRDLGQLGWTASTGRQPPVTIPFAAPFDTYSDMSYLLAREGWSAEAAGGTAPRHLAYLCAPLPDDEPVPAADGDASYPARQKQRVRANLESWLGKSAPALWPAAAAPAEAGGFDWDRLVDPQGRRGADRLDSQYHCAVVHPSDRYVLAIPGTNRHRLRADESGYDNLVLAGDWTLTAFSIGCLEAATMSGFAAARAIDADCRKAFGDWLPERSRPRRERPAEDPSLPAYITSGQLMAVPPLRMRTDLSMFLLEASPGPLEALCDRYLNLPGSPVRYRPLSPHVVLYCSTADTAPVDDPIGWCPERDFGFWLPVVGQARDEDPRYAVFTPYLWVDSGVAMMGGREVYGFAKELGRLTMPEDRNADGTRAGLHAIDTLVLTRYGRQTCVSEQRLLTVTPRGGLASSLRSLVGSGGHLLEQREYLQQAGAPASFLGFLRGILEDRQLRMVFLKQFPDVVDPGRACYQAIVEAPIRITSSVRGGVMSSGFDVTLAACASHPLVEVLGLRCARWSTAEAVVPSRLAVHLSFDAAVDPGEVVHERAAQRTARSLPAAARVAAAAGGS